MSGWRARIGIISPIGEAVERAFNLYSPDGVAINSTKIWFPGPSEEGLIYLGEQLEEAAKLFGKQRHDLVFFGCTTGSLIKGFGYDKECIKKIETASGAPGLTTSTAVLEAFARLGVGSTAVVTPYPDATNEAERIFLEDNGIRVTNIEGMDDSPIRQVPSMSEGIVRVKGDAQDIEPSRLYRAGKELALNGAESLFISCAGMNTMEIVEALETDLGIPVITSNQAGLWSALRHCKVGTKNPALGKLFTL